MLVHYFWINDHPLLKKVGFNLSNQFQFHFEEQTTKLAIREAKSYLPAIFGPQVSNFTAIIGENGSGKTTALRYFIAFLSDGRSDDLPPGDVIIYEMDGKLLYITNSEIMFDNQTNVETPKKSNNLYSLRSAATTIFASHNFDPSSSIRGYLSDQLGEMKNLSTSYLAYVDIQNQTGLDAFKTDIPFESRMSAFAAMEFLRMVRLIKWLNDKREGGRPFPVRLPKYVNFALNFPIEESYKEALKGLKGKIEEYFDLTKGKPSDAFLLNAFTASIFHFMSETKFIVGNESIPGIYKTLPDVVLLYLSQGQSVAPTDESLMLELDKIFRFMLSDENLSLIKSRILEMQSFMYLIDGFLNSSHPEILGEKFHRIYPSRKRRSGI